MYPTERKETVLKRFAPIVLVIGIAVSPVVMSAPASAQGPDIVNHGACTQIIRDLGESPSILSPGQSDIGPLTINPNGELVGTPKAFIGWMGCSR